MRIISSVDGGDVRGVGAGGTKGAGLLSIGVLRCHPDVVAGMQAPCADSRNVAGHGCRVGERPLCGREIPVAMPRRAFSHPEMPANLGKTALSAYISGMSKARDSGQEIARFFCSSQTKAFHERPDRQRSTAPRPNTAPIPSRF